MADSESTKQVTEIRVCRAILAGTVLAMTVAILSAVVDSRAAFLAAKMSFELS